jgi:superfamily II DNA or RNA helicase
LRIFRLSRREQMIVAQLPRGIDDAAERVRHLVGDGREPAPTTGAQQKTSQRRILQPHQAAVLESWRAAGHRGIVAHVTGAGKTITALQAIREWCESGRPALIFVPSDLLAKQWSLEVAKDLDDLKPSVITAGAGNARSTWESLLPDLTRDMQGLGPRITIATMPTASKDHFISRVQGGPHLLVVSDEVHRMGSSGSAQTLTIDAGGRLGLSATPERYGDPVGTARILAYFGRRLAPPFGIPEAIRAGRLVPYDYYVHTVRLTAEEQEQWDQLTSESNAISLACPRAMAARESRCDRFQLMLFRRASILKQARNKTETAMHVLETEYKEGDRWLVYCDAQDQLGAILSGFQRKNLPASNITAPWSANVRRR